MNNQIKFGAPAIQPHLPTIPAFTEEDVRNYVTTYPAHGGSISSVKSLTVIRIAFMTTQKASELICNFISWHKEDLVCYVELEGAFIFKGGPPGYVPGNETTSADTRVFEILDAQTGNCLVTGFLPAKHDE